MPCNIHTRAEWIVSPDLDSQVCVLDHEHEGEQAIDRRQAAKRRCRILTQPVTPPVHTREIHYARRQFSPQWRHSGREWLPIGWLTLLRRT